MRELEKELHEKTQNRGSDNPKKPKFYRKRWVRITAFVLAFVMTASVWISSIIHIRIQRGEKMDAATNYLVDNTEYVNQGELQRLQEKFQTYQEASELEDYYRLAGTQIAQEEYGEALDSVEKCLELYSGGDDELHLDLMIKRACLLVLIGQEDEALTALDQVLEKQPDHTDAFLIKAQIYAERQQLEPLTEALAAYIELKPQEHSIRMVYAQALFEQQLFEEAVAEYQLLLEAETDQLGKSELWYLLGLTQIQLSNYPESEKALLEAKLGNPDLEGLDYYIGICQMSREAYGEAVESFTASIEAESMLQHSHYSRGVCQLMLDRPDIEAVREDLLYVSGYDGEDADSNVKIQADDLLAQLEDVID